MDPAVVTVSVLMPGVEPGEGFVKPLDALPRLLHWKAETLPERGTGEPRDLTGEAGSAASIGRN
jgi:hypothetical protein